MSKKNGTEGTLERVEQAFIRRRLLQHLEMNDRRRIAGSVKCGNEASEKERRRGKTRLTRQPYPHDLENGLSVDGNIVSLEAFGVGDGWSVGGGKSPEEKEEVVNASASSRVKGREKGRWTYCAP